MSTIVINTQKVSKLTQIRLEKAGYKNHELTKSPPEKPTLVLVHGYGGTGTEFYYLFPLLSLNFKIVVFDLIGCGSSSRPKWNAKNGTEADEYYMRIIENWRKEMDLTDFILVAHSYGGYLMGTYASLYPQHIRKLVLLSPVGLRVKPENAAKIARDDWFDETPDAFRTLKDELWGKVTPFKM